MVATPSDTADANPVEHPLYRKPDDLDNDLVVKAAYELAEEECHYGQMRKKRDGVQLPYMTHINLTYHILRMLGENNPITLASAILHDAIEDDPSFTERRTADLEFL